MTSPTRTTRLSFLLLTIVSLTLAQSLTPSMPSKEYIRMGGQIIAIENGPPQGPNGQLSPTTLAFGSQNVGSSSVGQPVTLTNSGNAALPITSTSISISGANFTEFSSINNCGTSLAAAGSCTVTVTFTPAATGNRTATLAIDGFAQMVSLSGTGANTSPIVSLSSASLAFGSQAPGTPSFSQTITLTNTGTVDLVFSSLPTLGGSNPGDFNVSGSNCEPQFGPVASRASCKVVVNFTPLLSGARSATLTFTDNASASTQTVTLSGTGSGAASPSLTTYLGTYGNAASPLSGPAAMLPIRAYYSGGAAQISYVQTVLSSGYTILAEQNGSGGYFLSVSNGSGAYATIDALTASSATVSLASPLIVGSLKLTAYRFALAGNELQLDLSLTRSDSFNDQIVISAVLPSNAGYSSPWMASDGQWSSATAAGSTCSGTSISGSILMGAGSWQCWTGSQLNTTNYGNPFWNGNSGDGNQSGIGWLMTGTGGQNSLSVSAPGALGYFGSAGGGGAGNSLYFAGTGASVTVSRLAKLTNNASVDSVGWYSIDPNNPNTAPTAATMHALVSYTVAAATFQPTPYYGLYLSGPSGTFYFTQPQFNQVNVDGLQHFAVFQQSASSYYIGVEDTGKTESDLDYNDMVVQLTVGGSSAAPAVTLSPTSLSFGNQTVPTTSASQTVTLSNTGTAALTINSLAITGSNSGDFSKTTTCGSSVAVGGNCTVAVAFTPAAAGSRSASLTIGDNAAGSPHTVALSGTGVVATGGATATYAGSDTTTQGTWTGKYGADGQLIANGLSNVPAYASVNITGAATYTWAGPTDARALQVASGSATRIASVYYSGTAFTIDVNLTDGNAHKISLYLCDWDAYGRAETISIVDAASGATLDSETFSSFVNGAYASWVIKGHVKIQVTRTASVNGVVNGIFFDSSSSGGGGATATYAGADVTTQGTWTSKYGADGQLIANGLSNVPAYASVGITNAATYTWAGTTDPRALQVASGSTTRIASVYYSSSAFTIDVSLTDGNAHKISLYLCDWDAYGRAETISIADAASGAVLDSEAFSSFVNGTYASWVIKGHVKIQVTRTASVNGVVNGIFFDSGS